MGNPYPVYGLGNEGVALKATVASGVVTTDGAPSSVIGAAGVDVVSRPILLAHLHLLSLHPIVTGNIAGTWAIEWSNNYSPGTEEGFGQLPNAGNWAVENPALIAAPAGSGQNDNVEIAFRAFRHVRVRFTPSGGTGTVSLFVCAKGF